MNKIVPFRAEHIELMELRDYEKELFEMGLGNKLVALAEIGMGGTLLHDGRIIGAFGYMELWQGVYEVWIIPSIYVSQYATIFGKRVKKLLDTIAKTHEVHRFQTTSPSDALHDKWMRFLGFECETPDGMKNYTVNKNEYKMWSRIKA